MSAALQLPVIIKLPTALVPCTMCQRAVEVKVRPSFYNNDAHTAIPAKCGHCGAIVYGRLMPEQYAERRVELPPGDAGKRKRASGSGD